MSSLTSSFVIRYIAGTDSLYVEEQVVKYASDSSTTESAGSLMQIYNTDTKSVTPDWSVSTNQPVLKLGLSRSGTGENVTLASGCSFTFQGEDISFSSSASTIGAYSDWNTSSDGLFAMRYDKDGTYVYLRITDNIASSTITSNQTIGYTLVYSDTDLGSGTISGTTDVVIREGSSSSVYVNITTSDTELDADSTSTTLGLQLIYGEKEYTTLSALSADMDDATLSLKWFKDGAVITTTSSGSAYTGDTLVVYCSEADDSGSLTGNYVDGCNVFSVNIYNADGAIIASDSQRVTDVTDPYQVRLTKMGSLSASKESVTIAGCLYHNDDAYEGSVTYTLRALNQTSEETSDLGAQTGTSGFSVAVPLSAAAYTNDDGGTEYGDVTLVVDVEY